MTVTRATVTPPEVLFRAWDQAAWSLVCCAQLSVDESRNQYSFLFRNALRGPETPALWRFLRLEPGKLVELTWVTAATKVAETIVTVEFLSKRCEHRTETYPFPVFWTRTRKETRGSVAKGARDAGSTDDGM